VNEANKKINRQVAGKCTPKSTTGIDIVRFAVPHPDHTDTGEPLVFSCWDFAGQQTCKYDFDAPSFLLPV
jgi:hypothetical protein